MAGILERIEEWKKLQAEDLGPAGIRRRRDCALRVGALPHNARLPLYSGCCPKRAPAPSWSHRVAAGDGASCSKYSGYRLGGLGKNLRWAAVGRWEANRTSKSRFCKLVSQTHRDKTRRHRSRSLFRQQHMGVAPLRSGAGVPPN